MRRRPIVAPVKYDQNGIQPIGMWREIRCIEVTRPCGCIERLFEKDAIKSRADKLAAKPCYQCQLKARQQARERKSDGF